MIVKSTKGKDTVLDVLPDKESALKMFTTLKNEERLTMTGKKSPVKAELMLQKVTKYGTLVGRNKNGVRIRWDYEETATKRVEPIQKYSMNHAKKLAKPRF